MFKLTIATPDAHVYEGEINALTFSSEDGVMQILENHASISATVLFSTIEIEEANKEEYFIGRNGIFFFDNEKNEGKLMLTYCQKKSEVDHMTVKQYLEFLEKQLEEGKDLSEFQILYLQNERVAIQQQVEEDY